MMQDSAATPTYIISIGGEQTRARRFLNGQDSTETSTIASTDIATELNSLYLASKPRKRGRYWENSFTRSTRKHRK